MYLVFRFEGREIYKKTEYRAAGVHRWQQLNNGSWVIMWPYLNMTDNTAVILINQSQRTGS